MAQVMVEVLLYEYLINNQEIVIQDQFQCAYCGDTFQNRNTFYDHEDGCTLRCGGCTLRCDVMCQHGIITLPISLEEIV